MYAMNTPVVEDRVTGTGRTAPRLRLVEGTGVPVRRPRPAYWRRRLAFLAITTTLVLGARSVGGESSPQPISETSHIVQRGDTLWSIARELQPEGDVRPLVDRLSDVRQGRPLQVGERIPLPLEP